MFWGVARFCVGVPPNVIQKGVRNGASTRPIPEALLTFMPGNTKQPSSEWSIWPKRWQGFPGSDKDILCHLGRHPLAQPGSAVMRDGISVLTH
jgi:hypothetical protein